MLMQQRGGGTDIEVSQQKVNPREENSHMTLLNIALWRLAFHCNGWLVTKLKTDSDICVGDTVGYVNLAYDTVCSTRKSGILHCNC